MEELQRILNQLQSTSGAKEKQQIIKDNLNNNLFVSTMKFLLNDFIVTGLSTKKMNKKVDVTISNKLSSLEDMYTYLKDNNTGKDYDIAVINNFIYDNFEYKEFITLLATKSLKLGITATTWNKIVNDNDKLPVFDCMLAQKYFDNQDYVENRMFSLTMKRDGNRCIFTKDNGKITAYTRQGQSYIGLVDLENELSKLNTDNVAIDGELMVLNDSDIKSDEQFKATMKIVRKDGEKHGVKLVVFDYMPLDDFKKGLCKIDYSTRRKSLENVFSNCTYFEPVKKLYEGNDDSVIMKLLDEVTEQGEEGLMININSAPYECKRTKNLLKVKKMQTCDLRVIGFEEGEGKLKGTLGKIIVDYKGNEVGVGSGYSIEDRDYFWRNKEKLINRVIEIQYFEETTNQKNDKLSLRFPVYKKLREEGKEVSYY